MMPIYILQVTVEVISSKNKVKIFVFYFLDRCIKNIYYMCICANKDIKDFKMERIAKHVKTNLIWYSLLAIGLGFGLHFIFPGFVRKNTVLLKNITTVFVFLMIYPMMINLNLGKVVEIVKEPKVILASVVYNFVVTPLVSFVIAKLFLHNADLTLGFWLVMLIPGSSMSIGYTGLADGDIETASIAMGVNFLLIPLMLPLLLHFATKGSDVQIPIRTLLLTILLVLIIPMILGYATRRFLMRKEGEQGFKKFKHHISFITMISMLFVVVNIFFMKAALLISHWQILIPLAGVTLLYLVIMLPLITWSNKLLKIGYKRHMGIVFLSTGKNNGTAIAIAMLGFNAMVAIPAAVLPIFQIIFLVLYLQVVPLVKKFYGYQSKAS